MNKPIRKAVRCYLIKDNKVVVTKYKEGNNNDRYNLKMNIQVDEKENILDVK